MKKQTIRVLHTIEVIIVIFAICIFILANPKTLTYIVDTVSSKYDLKYKNLSGNILTNIHINDISYKGDIIAKNAEIDFNLLKLLILQLDIRYIEFTEVDMKNLKFFINSFEEDSSLKSKQLSSSQKLGSLPIIVNIHHIFLDIKPYNKDKIEIKKLNIDLRDFYIGSNIDINNIKVNILSNYFDLKYSGSYKDKDLDIDYMNISNLDIKKVLLLKNMIKKDSESNSSIIKKIYIKKVRLSIKPYKKGKYDIRSLKVSVRNLFTDLRTYNAKDINLSISTNIWNLKSTGFIKNSLFNTKVKVDLNNKYFKKFVPFVNYNSLNPIDVKLKIDKNRLIGDINATSKKLLSKKLDDKLKILLHSLNTHAEFDFDKLKLHFKTDANLSSKYSKDIRLNGDFDYKYKLGIFYHGKITFKKLSEKCINPKIKKLLTNSIITFNGNKKGVIADLKSDYLVGNYDSNDSYIKPKIYIKSKTFLAKDFDTNLTDKLNDLNLSFIIKTDLDYKKIKNTIIEYKINSNICNIKGNYIPIKNISKFKAFSIKNSILSDFDKNIHIKNFFPIDGEIKKDIENIKVNLNNNDIDILSIYNLKNSRFDIKAKTLTSTIHIFNENKSIKYQLDFASLKDFFKMVNKYYTLPQINLDGEVGINGLLEDNIFSFQLSSKWLLYEYSKYKYFFMESIQANCSFQDNILYIDNFTSNGYILDRYRKLGLDSNSTISFDKEGTNVDLVLNNSIFIKGIISDITKLNIYSDYYHLQEPEANLFIKFNLNFFSSLYSSSLKGKINLLKGVIKYKPKNSHEVNDEDIVFVNKQKQKLTSEKNFNILINILTNENIQYIQGNNKITFFSDLTFYKEKKDSVKLYGHIKIVDGVYFSDNKRFEVGAGEILFSGEVLNPYLNLKAYYKKDTYDITIHIGGKLDSPILTFSSTPYLTQNDILSILLFNTKASYLTNSEGKNSNPAISLFGTSFAKGITKALGVKLDRIELSTTKDGAISFEFEKKLSNKITIIYQNDLVQTIKIRYKNSKNIETDLTFSPESSGIDIIYKNEK